MSQGSDSENNLIEAIHLLCEARVFSYDILRQIFIKELEQGLFTTIKDEAILSGFPFIEENLLIQEGISLTNQFLEQSDIPFEELLDALRWDYTRLFIGPEKLPAPPWESVYLSRDRLLFQKQTMQVRRIYRKFGYVPSNHPHEADDHLGLELDFMFRLASQTKEDIDQKEFDSALDLLKDQSSFLEEHLLEWVPLFVEDVLKSAETLFFQGMAKILQGYLEQDRGLIDEITEAIRKVSVVC
jgi:TorA maturation chaperone TorD